MSNSDRIEKKLTLRAPRARVWQALSSAEQFGRWFGVRFEGRFEPGATVRGQLTIPGYDHLAIEMQIERIEPERLFAYRWHPNNVDAKRDYSQEPMTRVEFRLDEAPGGTQLTLIESGFDALPADRRAQAFRSNQGGWDEQLPKLERDVSA